MHDGVVCSSTLYAHVTLTLSYPVGQKGSL